MDYVWSPWRYKYISAAAKQDGCVFCKIAGENIDEQNYVLNRSKHNFIILNIFPYTCGHLMIVPYKHTSELCLLEKEISDEMMDLLKHCQKVIFQEYRCNGINLGMNIGKAAGAGIVEHVHMHILPRWIGDANFTTTIAETRILPEELTTTYARLKKYF
ncbi:MAG: HIT domain-containing protein [Acidobacteriota bacterium]|nr:HIT domain-containing protein [Blastocatellia bacterium]MDW8411339.1 HIT domain-containing protein [Acidobacteriota bacterium]